MIVRNAGKCDLNAVVSMGEAMRGESAMKFPPVEPERVMRTIEMSCDMPSLFWLGLADADGVVVGLLNAMVGDYAFSSERRGLVDTIYVTPSSRGGRAAISLMRAYLNWATSNGAVRHYAGDLAGIEPDRTARFLARMGFRRAGSLYVGGA